MNTLIILLEKTEKNKFLLFLYFLFLPIFYLIEYICYKYFWKKILTEMLENDDMVKFFDENEFGFKTNKLYKIDIVEPDTFLDQFRIDELKLKIYQEISEILTQKISEITAFNLEDYINVSVRIDIVEGLKQYTIELRYYRYYLVKTNFIWLILWLFTVTSAIIGYKFFL